MKESFRILLGLFLVFVVVANAPVAFSQVEEENLSTGELTGEIVSINSKKSAAVVKYIVDNETQTHKTAVFYLNDATKIDKYGEMVGVSDLKEGDTVTLQYATDAEGRKIIDFIVVEP